MKQLNVGMIGYGFMGKMHSYAYAALPFVYDPPPARVKLLGVCATSEATRKLAIDRAGYEFATDDYRELVARDDIDLVNICTPNYLHKEHVLAALAAGKHVYCDKPLAMNAGEARELVEAARKAGTTCQVTFHNRFVPAVMRARELVESGAIGEVFSFRAAYLHSGYADPERPMSWRMHVEKSGGGAIVDLGSHVIDLVRYLAGDIARVNATLRTIVKERPVYKGARERQSVTVDDMAIMQVELANGAPGTIEASRVATGAADDLRIEIHGARGAIRYDLSDPNWLWAYDDTRPYAPLGGDRGWKRIECLENYRKPAALPSGKNPVGWTRFHIASIFEFVCNAAGGRQGDPSFEDGLAVHEVIDAAIRSAKSEAWERV